MLILDQKGANLDQKGPKMSGARFLRTININFRKANHKISFYTKIQQNSMKKLDDISQYVDFLFKRGKLGQKRAQNGRGSIFPEPRTSIF